MDNVIRIADYQEEPLMSVEDMLQMGDILREVVESHPHHWALIPGTQLTVTLDLVPPYALGELQESIEVVVNPRTGACLTVDLHQKVVAINSCFC